MRGNALMYTYPFPLAYPFLVENNSHLKAYVYTLYRRYDVNTSISMHITQGNKLSALMYQGFQPISDAKARGSVTTYITHVYIIVLYLLLLIVYVRLFIIVIGGQ